MPRRPPPTSLKLVQGPLPPRGEPKHTLPSCPRPVFCPSDASSFRSAPNAGSANTHVSQVSLSAQRKPSHVSADTQQRILAPACSTRIVAPWVKKRGPWDYSILIPSLDVDFILPPPKPVAINE